MRSSIGVMLASAISLATFLFGSLALGQNFLSVDDASIAANTSFSTSGSLLDRGESFPWGQTTSQQPYSAEFAATATMAFPGAAPAAFAQPVTSDLQSAGGSSGVVQAAAYSDCAQSEGSQGNLCTGCDECPRCGLIYFLGYDSWKGYPDGGWQNNGLHTGVNFGTRLGTLSDLTGIGFQIGGSVGVDDWSGTDYRLKNNDQAEMQGFVTYGFFRKADGISRVSAAVVQDWMINSTYGVFGENPTLCQWRAYIGYAVNDWNEWGLWGTWRAQGDKRDVPGFGEVVWKPVDQLNLFWHYKWRQSLVDTYLWVGVPERDRIAGGGSLGDWIAGALANVPFGDRVGLYSLVTYMHPSAAAGPAGFDEESWNFTIGLSYYFGRTARSNTVAGQCWMPLLPVANNGTFLVDTNQIY